MRRLIWDADIGEVRAGLYHGDQLSAFRLIRSAEIMPGLPPGAHYTARVLGQAQGNRTLVSYGDGDAWMTPPATAREGALVAARVVRAPIPEPGRWKRAVVRQIEPGPDDRVAPVSALSPEAALLAPIASAVDVIICPSAGVANHVDAALDEALGQSAARPAVTIDQREIEAADFDTLIDRAVSGAWPITDGMLHIERTRAMVMIDVDGAGAPLALNLAAAQAIPGLLHLLDIGGPVGIDFVSLANRAERSRVAEQLAAAAAPFGPIEMTAINGFGFCQLIRPRTHASIPELLCATTPGRLSVPSRALALLRVAARSHGAGTRRLIAPLAVIDCLAGWPMALAKLAAMLGHRIDLVGDAAASGYGHVHVATP